MKKRITISFDYTIPDNELGALQLAAANRAIEFLLLRFHENTESMLEHHNITVDSWGEMEETL